MSSFTRFDARLLTSYDPHASAILGKDYWLVELGFRYYLGDKDSTKWVDIPKYFLTDGASVPRFLWNLIPPWGIYGQAAVVHDWLCEHLYICEQVADGTIVHTPITRKQCDQILYEAMQVLGVPKLNLYVIQAGVNLYRMVANPQKPVVAQAKLDLEATYVKQELAA
jgi:hypothetical protein